MSTLETPVRDPAVDKATLTALAEIIQCIPSDDEDEISICRVAFFTSLLNSGLRVSLLELQK